MGFLTGKSATGPQLGDLIPKAPVYPPKKEPTETFRWLRGHEENFLKYQFDISKWVMASLLLINGGGLWSLPALAEKHPDIGDAAPWFLVGVIAAVLVGTFAWFNCNCITMSVRSRTNWEELDYQESDKADRWDKAAAAFAWASVVCVLIALSMFTTGAVAVQHGATKPTQTPLPTSGPAKARGRIG